MMQAAVVPLAPPRYAFADLPGLLSQPDRLIQACAAFSAVDLEARALSARPGEPYGRTVLHKDALGEVMLARWRGDEACAPHDHGRSHGAVWIVSGSFKETWYRVDRGLFRAFAEHTHATGSLVPVERDVIHAMEPVGPAITLHMYAPSVSCMRVFDRDRAEALTVDDSCGAWIPRDVRLVNARTCFSALIK